MATHDEFVRFQIDLVAEFAVLFEEAFSGYFVDEIPCFLDSYCQVLSAEFKVEAIVITIPVFLF